MNSYTASSIVILPPTEITRRFTWQHAASLATQYRRPVAWIERGLEACRRAGVDSDYFEQRYLLRRAIPCNALVDDAFRELLRE